MATKTCNSWNKDVLDAWLSGKTLKMALFTAAAALSETTTTYSTTNEVTGTNYTAGGVAVASLVDATVTGGAKLTCANPVFTNVTVSGVRYAMIYDVATNKAVSVHDFGSDQAATAANFTVTIDATNGFAKITSL